LYRNVTELSKSVRLSGVATIDTLPIPALQAASRSMRIQAVQAPTLDTVGRPIDPDR